MELVFEACGKVNVGPEGQRRVGHDWPASQDVRITDVPEIGGTVELGRLEAKSLKSRNPLARTPGPWPLGVTFLIRMNSWVETSRLDVGDSRFLNSHHLDMVTWFFTSLATRPLRCCRILIAGEAFGIWHLI